MMTFKILKSLFKKKNITMMVLNVSLTQQILKPVGLFWQTANNGVTVPAIPFLQRNIINTIKLIWYQRITTWGWNSCPVLAFSKMFIIHNSGSSTEQETGWAGCQGRCYPALSEEAALSRRQILTSNFHTKWGKDERVGFPKC